MKKICKRCKAKNSKEWYALFKWEPDIEGSMTITPEELEERIVGYLCWSCHQVVNNIN